MSCGRPHEVDCQVVLDRLYSYLDNELDLNDVTQLQQHLQECGPCMTEFDFDRAVQAVLRRSCACEQAPEELRQRIHVQITQLSIRRIQD